ncbi:MAG: hypothetical protein M0035_11095, partial [Actinomycetota bacterium]|nr:hypothetical protein [Actinomycetota bacterium]
MVSGRAVMQGQDGVLGWDGSWEPPGYRVAGRRAAGCCAGDGVGVDPDGPSGPDRARVTSSWVMAVGTPPTAGRVLGPVGGDPH